MTTTMEIIQGISQAVANKHHGSRKDNGKGDFQEIGLRREEVKPYTDKGVMDGFGVSIGGHQLKLHYQSEISLKEVYGNKFEDEIIDILEQCISYIKKEYRKVTKKGLSLKMVGEPVVRVEHMNKVRSWVTAYCIYDIEGIEKPEDETFNKRMKETEKYWNGFSKDKKATQLKETKNVSKLLERFSAEEAYEAHKSGEPIMISRKGLVKIIQQHGLYVDDFFADNPKLEKAESFDAWVVLSWLGY